MSSHGSVTRLIQDLRSADRDVREYYSVNKIGRIGDMIKVDSIR